SLRFPAIQRAIEKKLDSFSIPTLTDKGSSDDAH
ncbi:hypothetical protein AZO1586I_258, partial [Bathymodiolus thermophilus thioautotrophic gill symbiont]